MALVLVAEDKADLREVLRLMLEHEGCSVVEAADGRELLKQAAASEPALILLDLAMPVMDGLEACRKLRQDARTGMLPIVAMTAHGDKMAEAMIAGCTECIPKPVSFNRLRDVLSKYVTDLAHAS